jgi:hypothetical protein
MGFHAEIAEDREGPLACAVIPSERSESRNRTFTVEMYEAAHGASPSTTQEKDFGSRSSLSLRQGLAHPPRNSLQRDRARRRW